MIKLTYSLRILSLLVIVFTLSACAGSDTTPSNNGSGKNTGEGDAGFVEPDADVGDDANTDPGDGSDADADADADDGSDADTGGGSDPGAGDGTLPPPNPGPHPNPPQITATGNDGLLLKGIVLTPDGVLDPGQVLIEEDIITCVAQDCSEEMAGGSFTIVETQDVISPGLIDSHNHLHYNFLPPWFPDPSVSYSNRNQWREAAAYKEHVRPYSEGGGTNDRFCPGAKWGELRSLIHGTTTMQGQTFVRRCIINGIRNADLSYHHLGYQHMQTTIASPRDINKDQAEKYIENFQKDTRPTTRLAVHMQEGYEGNRITEEFDSFDGKDSRERYQHSSLLEWGTAVLIHSVSLTPAQIERVYYTDSMIVWSPTSNFALYGVTAPIDQFLEANITLGIGPDWTISGAFDLPHEMRVAYNYGVEQEIELLTPKRIWEMATWEGAIVVGLHEHIGRLEPGMKADIAIFRHTTDDPYLSVIASRTSDVELVLIDGEAHFGAGELADLGKNAFCEDFDACGVEKFICVKESESATDRANETLGDIRDQLIHILDEYGRADELLELAICDI